MAAEAEATREARAKVIAAEGEELSSRALSQAAELISQSPSAIHLSMLQTLKAISAEKNQTIVVPIPVELVRWLNKMWVSIGWGQVGKRAKARDELNDFRRKNMKLAK